MIKQLVGETVAEFAERLWIRNASELVSRIGENSVVRVDNNWLFSDGSVGHFHNFKGEYWFQEGLSNDQ